MSRGCRNGYKFSSEAAAQFAVAKGADGDPYKCSLCPWWHLKEPHEHTGFPPAAKLAVRTRAGNGDISAAVCECCGVRLGKNGGEVQHVVARGMGGTSLEIMNSAANGALLCGSAVMRTGHHGAAEKREPEMEAKGFYVKGRKDPRTVPMTLFDGREVFRSEDGRYLDEAPGRWAA